MKRRSVLAAVAVAGLAVAVLVLGGCGTSVRGTGAGQGSLQATATQAVDRTATETPGAIDAQTQPQNTGSSGAAAKPPASTGQDVKAIDAELNAMQKELDSMAMPADSDFSGAEGVLY